MTGATRSPVETLGPEEFRVWNEEMARRYDPELFHTGTSSVIRRLEQARVIAISDMVAATASDRILDVGCGAGNILEKIPAGLLRVGMDLSDYLICKAKIRFAPPSNALLLRADAELLPFRDGLFTKVICSEVLEHLQRPREALAEMARVTSPQGLVVLSIPNEPLIDRLKDLTLLPGLRRLVNGGDYQAPQRMEEQWHVHRFDLSVLRSYLPDCLHQVEVKGIPNRLLPVRWVVGCRKDPGIEETPMPAISRPGSR